MLWAHESSQRFNVASLFLSISPLFKQYPKLPPPPPQKRNTNNTISQNLCLLCAFLRKEIRFRRRLLPSFSVFLCVSFCDQHLSETSYSSVRPGLLLPPSYRVELRSFLYAFQQVFVNPTVGELAPANS